jgi:hypothetical protein
LAATTNKVYALSSSGDIYAVAAARNLQKSEPADQSPSSSSSWWNTFGLGKLAGVFSQDPGVDFVKLDVAGDGGLKKGERYVHTACQLDNRITLIHLSCTLPGL